MHTGFQKSKEDRDPGTPTLTVMYSLPTGRRTVKMKLASPTAFCADYVGCTSLAQGTPSVYTILQFLIKWLQMFRAGREHGTRRSTEAPF